MTEDTNSSDDRIITEQGEYIAIVHEGEPEDLNYLFEDPLCSREEELHKVERAIQLIIDSADTHYLLANQMGQERDTVEDINDEFGDMMQRILILERMRLDIMGSEWEPYGDLDSLMAGYHIRDNC